ncbi:MAG TPA: cardiolipin synthase [Candidatus Faeciplasma pullistercoris]|uniref:Cardiolipin synthase n=1 Tax=Candidatus Faeciplasma pullistercoris TaxID=2840800 RepID=A0A9D1KKG0_9FIRM|nr:cardiolipin synthase [Candidatus Faeciplasma pullistercoris]
MRRFLKFIQSKIFITAVLVLIQLLVLFYFLISLTNNFVWYYVIGLILSVITVLDISSEPMNPSFKLTWIIAAMLFPLCGVPLYLIFAKSKQSYRIGKRFKSYKQMMRNAMRSTSDPLPEIEKDDPETARQMKYLQKYAYAPVYCNTETKYFPSGEEFYSDILRALTKAEKFIFMEYFIIEPGKMFDGILDILKKKISEGIEVRLMYDDLGTIQKLPKGYDRYLESLGIRVSVFNRVSPSLDTFLNYRDHRKILVIDGRVAFTGGINLADEYINAVERFGHWKDSGIMIKGDGVIKMTETFLQLWHFSRGESKIDYAEYSSDLLCEPDGYVQPFADGPSTDELICELAYIGLINCATKTLYVTTPYLILDNEMTTALRHAAMSGVDVRIITPSIPDKKMVFAVTRSNYRELLNAGVRIFEYTPGFIHAKSVTADSKVCIVGTANFDFRSFYLHFENCILAYKSKCVAQVEEDFLETQSKSKEITIEQLNKRGPVYAFVQAVLKIFSPLM